MLAMLDVEESMLDVATAERDELRTNISGRRPADGLRAPGGVPGGRHRRRCRLRPGCLADGDRWVALRQCLECGEVGCCDSSPGQHATAHFHEATHPVMQSAEPGEDWRWCYVHHQTA